ncbi:acyl-CoA dehydrogenase [Denitratisoma sp. DHT3]|uniref:acyl-CoA dehydrogenase family protein n=1 Tax=Denitratisoma sp. DHT3 TaxID=1981880 RepID=UPI0011989B08|nr:acyl-CoA dehydrogenase family protein [Denitratisoma sp. DHT3]QDX80172.1 acyl-CoA dehydrogenase [Denitratisoma sp. DHT3]
MNELDTFRTEVRAWVEANYPASLRSPILEGELPMASSKIDFKSADARLWYERMRDKGWLAPDWPAEYGGAGLDAARARIVEVELSRAGCRQPLVSLGIWMIGPVLLEFGTDEQKARYLPGTGRGEIGWCQGFSEPNAGSDLASLKMSAVQDGDDFVVNGSKIWTSYAFLADQMYALVRTSNEGNKQQGITMVLIDMKSPGITVRPIDLISGKSSFCQVFFDNVRVPLKNMVGPLNGGWGVAKRLLTFERKAMSKFSELNLPGPSLVPIVKKALGDANGRIGSAVMRDKVAGLEIETHVQGLTQQRIVEMMKAGKDVTNVSATMKYQLSDTLKKGSETMVAALGLQGLGWESEGFAKDELEATKQWLNDKAHSIAGGSSEVQLNIIAKRVLGLPE